MNMPRVPVPAAPAAVMPFEVEHEEGERESFFFKGLDGLDQLILRCRGIAGIPQPKRIARQERSASTERAVVCEGLLKIVPIRKEIPVAVARLFMARCEPAGLWIDERRLTVIEKEVAGAAEDARWIFLPFFNQLPEWFRPFVTIRLLNDLAEAELALAVFGIDLAGSRALASPGVVPE